jgi:DNA segregation ATPase FtsK/SpoIIIE-like protein
MFVRSNACESMRLSTAFGETKMMSCGTETNFDAMQALRILIKLEDTPDADTCYLRGLVVADVKRQLTAAPAEEEVIEAAAEDDAAEDEAASEPEAAEEAVEAADDAVDDVAEEVEEAAAQEEEAPEAAPEPEPEVKKPAKAKAKV